MHLSIFQPTIKFLGVKPPYKINGITVYPIERDLSVEQMEEVKRCITNERFIGQGLNGKVYRINENYVVKVPIPNRRVKDSIMQETKKLDMLYDFSKERNIDLQNSQRGIASFFTDSGEEYLISTFVKGSECNPNNRLNPKNINSMMNILTEMDIGSKKYGRLMSYDYNGHNVNFTETSAGVFDLEYLRGNFLENDIPNRVLSGRKSVSPHVSDTSGLTSNVRTFEFGNLYSYLKSLPDNEARNDFVEYLNRKSLYHIDMSEYYKLIANDNKYNDFLQKLSKKEQIHSELLKKENLTEDIIKSEAIKIQISEFIYRVDGSKIRGNFNPQQIVKYYKNSLNFFRKNLHKAMENKEKELATYYYDCINNLRIWSDISRIQYKNIDKSRISKIIERTLDKIVARL